MGFLERNFMKKEHRFLIKMGLSLSFLVLASYQQGDLTQAIPTIYAMEDTEQSYFINQNALAFINEHASPSQFNTWSESNDLGITPQQAAEIKEFVTKQIITNPNASDIEKAEEIFEWLKKEIRYPQTNQNPSINPYQVFKRKLAVCGGYSNLYKTMLNAIDIPSVIVFGTIPANSSNGSAILDTAHQWNAVYADGKWFYSDSTWGGDYFKKELAAFSTNHRTTNIHKVTYTDKDLTIGYEYSGLAVVGVTAGTEHLTIPSDSKGQPIQALSNSLPTSNNQLKKITLGANIKNFELAALNFPQLERIEVDNANAVYQAKDGVLFSKDLSNILYYPENRRSEQFIIPKETITYDEKQTFQSSYLKTLEVEDGNPKYASYKGALFNKDKTSLLTVPEGAKEVFIPGSVQLDNSGLSFKPNLERVVLEEGIRIIPEGTFNASPKLREIVLPDTLVSISETAFGTSNNKQITLIGQENSPGRKYAAAHSMTFRLKEESKPSTPPSSNQFEQEVLALQELIQKGMIAPEELEAILKEGTTLAQSLADDDPRKIKLLQILEQIKQASSNKPSNNPEETTTQSEPETTLPQQSTEETSSSVTHQTTESSQKSNGDGVTNEEQPPYQGHLEQESQTTTQETEISKGNGVTNEEQPPYQGHLEQESQTTTQEIATTEAQTTTTEAQMTTQETEKTTETESKSNEQATQNGNTEQESQTTTQEEQMTTEEKKTAKGASVTAEEPPIFTGKLQSIQSTEMIQNPPTSTNADTLGKKQVLPNTGLSWSHSLLSIIGFASLFLAIVSKKQKSNLREK